MKLDNIELLIEDINRKDCELIQKIHKKDILLVEERLKKWENGGGWDDFVRIAKSDATDKNEEGKVDFTPIRMMCKFIENDGDPLVLNKLKPLEVKLPILFQDSGKKWLSGLFEVSKGFVREEQESKIQSAVDIADLCA